jgi:RimJ/RimL family protein N-acetyltransferase
MAFFVQLKCRFQVERLYDPALHRALDAWQSDSIARFAMDGSIREEWQYYLDASEYHAGVDTFCKVALLGDAPVAAMIVFCNPDYPVGINPIVVDPTRTGQGHGSAILREFIENIGAILPFHSDSIDVLIDLENTASIRAFEKAGFTPARLHPDGDAVIYEKNL